LQKIPIFRAMVGLIKKATMFLYAQKMERLLAKGCLI
jgi:hypothetical protein